MNKKFVYLITIHFLFATLISTELNGQKLTETNSIHLFIFSGQSNMVRLKPKEVFQPIMEKEYGKENIIIIKEAKGGQPVSRWYKDWKPVSGEAPDSTGDLYDQLMNKVMTATQGRKFKSVTIFWMQGERDAKDAQGEVYAESLQGILEQLRTDLSYKEINFICGRLSDFDMDNKKCPHWTMIRDIQQDFAESYANGAWINTDDLNDGLDAKGRDRRNALHYSVEGYKILGERYAEKAILLINNN